jgi:D-alanyl-lipoteichoic acid acyltransferase DltB (MBOAT superfamily)
MLFNSIEFAIFIPIVFVLYWFVTNHNLKLQNILVFVASYVFYGWWDWRFLFLIFFSSMVDFFIGQALSKQENQRKRNLLLLASLSINLGFLGYFKYANFFIQSFIDAFTFFGYRLDIQTLSIILPVGISFYTFQTLSYTIDVYRKKLEPTQDIVAFLAFVSFFPQLVAGPIERASNLLPQFYTKRTFDYKQATDGLRQVLWGLFKKVVIADNCALYANEVFNNHEDYTGFSILVGTFFFAIQIYCDFSGYSDVAIGISRTFGFNLMRNFAFPYFSRDMAEFWRRWHISLSTWFRDYIYIPLGGSRVSKWVQVRNTMIVFTVSGFWHGANWTYVFWGFLNALYFLPLLLLGQNRNNIGDIAENRYLPSLKEFFQILMTFSLTLLAWIFFRADSLNTAFSMIYKIIFEFQVSVLELRSVANSLDLAIKHVGYVGLFLLIEWIQRTKEHALEIDQMRIPFWVKWAFYYFLIFSIFFMGGGQQDFIYFQF